MAINSIDVIKPNGVASLACDSDSDRSNLAAYAKSNNLKMGTTCMVIATGKVYMMDSSYEFHEI